MSKVPNVNREMYVTPGMPPLSHGAKPVSYFEFWPVWLIYLPIAIEWLLLGLYHRSLTLPLIANPALPLSGMVGVPKSRLLEQARGDCNNAILPWLVHTIDHRTCTEQGIELTGRLKTQGLEFPLVCKPDIGSRGSGVKQVEDETALAEYLAHYPPGARVLIQKLSTWEPEAGVFYVREPDQPRGRIISMALKYSPYVSGDGEHTLAELIKSDPRACALAHLYKDRHAHNWNRVIPSGEYYRLVFSVSHCRGAIFRDANKYITPGLTAWVNRVMADLPDFYYGRLDIKFRDIDRLQQGEDIEIVEINAANSESLHIWDSNTSLRDAWGALLYQYRILFRLGAINRDRGHRQPRLAELIPYIRAEFRYAGTHPGTD